MRRKQGKLDIERLTGHVYGVYDAAALAGINFQHLYRVVKSGEVANVSTNAKRVLVRGDDVIAYVVKRQAEEALALARRYPRDNARREEREAERGAAFVSMPDVTERLDCLYLTVLDVLNVARDTVVAARDAYIDAVDAVLGTDEWRVKAREVGNWLGEVCGAGLDDAETRIASELNGVSIEELRARLRQ